MIPLAGNKVIRHPDDPKQQAFKFEIQCEWCVLTCIMTFPVALVKPLKLFMVLASNQSNDGVTVVYL